MGGVPGTPDRREADVVLRDGSTVHIRPATAQDEPDMLGFLRDLSPDSRAFRFFSASVDVEREARHSVDVDYRDRYALVATTGVHPRLVGHAIYFRTNGARAEAALAVADELQGKGLGTLLLAHLAQHASENGIETFEAIVLPQNHRMIDVFRESGFPVELKSSPGWIQAEFPTSLTPEALERFDRREQTAAAAALGTILAPRSVAVIGASRRPDSIGGAVFANLLASGFTGRVYPVNPNAEEVQEVRAFPTVENIPEPVDLAVIVVPAERVADAARSAAAKGVGALVVISAGFAEVGREGVERQRELLEICREAGMRLVGPNCMGVLNTNPDVLLNATFSPVFPARGRVGFLSQSGALGLAVMDLMQARGLGMSTFVSVGNKADISGNDLLHYWESDEDTDLVMLYLESFGNPRSFARNSSRIGRSKPILAVKSGRTKAGLRATSSHTGALLQGSDVTVDALFEQSGVIRTDSLAEMFDVAALLSSQPPPAGPRVAIVTNAGGAGILCADACEGSGLEVPPLPDELRKELASFLSPQAAVGNPVDMIASATAEQFGRAIEAIARARVADALIVIFVPPLVTRPEDVAREIRRAAERVEGALPLLVVFVSSAGPPPELREGGGPALATYGFPEDAARALTRAVRWTQWRARPAGAVPDLDVRGAEAAALVARELSDGRGWLGPQAVARLLDCYGIPLPPARVVSTPEEAGAAAEELGGAVALKALAPALVHKTEAGGVLLDLQGRSDVTEAADGMAAEVERAGFEVEGFLVQRMVPGGVELLVGVVHDASFGPVLACGAGGTTAELLNDVAVRITPLTDVAAAEMVRSLATFPLLDGYRGAPRADVAAVEDLLLRVGAMVEAHPEIAEMDLNPVKVLEEGIVVVDARVRLEHAPPPELIGARRPLG
ncbi:MAG TPA: GNAT family N-acetyltransferase [Actinomycetota bacterium]|nr:GNAT family N-acetyltransferase [Actinomycetota bacterium]